MAEKDKGGNVRVVVRFRPQSEAEFMNGGLMITSFDGSGKSVTVDVRLSFSYVLPRFPRDSLVCVPNKPLIIISDDNLGRWGRFLDCRAVLRRLSHTLSLTR
jgi:hypothetical protein